MDTQDIVGTRIGMLTVLSFEGQQPYKFRYNYYYKCRCDCGNETMVVRSNLKRGPLATRSCGCKRKRKGSANPTWTGHGDISGRLWGHIRNGAKERDLAFEITIEEAWALFEQQGRKCALTGFDLSMRTVKGTGPNAESASLDRIDNDKGYTLDNVQWLHKDINWMKGRFDQSRFIALCQAVARGSESDLCA